MKIILIICCLFTLIGNGYSQPIHSSKPLTQEDYLRKSMNQKTAGWLMLGGGVFMFTIGSAKYLQDILYTPNSAIILPLVGLGTALCSIPFFISAGDNRRKSICLSLGNQPLFFAPQNPSILKTQPTLTLTTRL